MGFGEAISAGFSNYVNFNDRASRSEYWYWILFTFIAEVVVAAIDRALGIHLIAGLLVLAIVIPTFAVTIRRLHDLDRSGWWIFLSFIPLIGGIILLIWFCTRGTEGPNRFGPDPLATLPLPGGQRIA
jgi:uncharacterized membrane protein YhaH (DUF805 family)